MPETWIAEEGLTGLCEDVAGIGDDLAGARRSLAGAGTGDLGWLTPRYEGALERCVDALQTAGAGASETAGKIMDCHRLFDDTDGSVELWFNGLEA